MLLKCSDWLPGHLYVVAKFTGCSGWVLGHRYVVANVF